VANQISVGIGDRPLVTLPTAIYKCLKLLFVFLPLLREIIQFFPLRHHSSAKISYNPCYKRAATTSKKHEATHGSGRGIAQ